MTPATFDRTLESLISRRPFRAFTVELQGGERFEIDHPGSTAWRDGHAVFLAGTGVKPFFRNFDHAGVVQFIDEPASDEPAIVNRG